MPRIPPIPPLAALRALEAVVRLGSFARAAEELHVTTSAVSHQITGLERNLGAKLIDRDGSNGQMTPTRVGKDLLTAVEGALGELGRVCEEIRRRSAQSRQVTVSSNMSIAALWLAPRLADFSALHPGAEIAAITRDDIPNLARANIDVAILRVRRDEKAAGDQDLFPETVFPVCSPALLASEPGLADPRGLKGVRLLQELHESSPEMDWQTWFDLLQLGPVPAGTVVRFSSFALAIGAAAAGSGVALGRTPLIDFELTSGRLVRMFPGIERPGSWRFVMRLCPGVAKDRTVQALTEFLSDQAVRSK
jgi:LysR family transcriptional regulator, glycine cleavage system transcriptional activator